MDDMVAQNDNPSLGEYLEKGLRLRLRNLGLYPIEKAKLICSGKNIEFGFLDSKDVSKYVILNRFTINECEVLVDVDNSGSIETIKMNTEFVGTHELGDGDGNYRLEIIVEPNKSNQSTVYLKSEAYNREFRI